MEFQYSKTAKQLEKTSAHGRGLCGINLDGIILLDSGSG